MITAFLQIFGKILLWIYEFCHSYALSLIIFTLLTKLVLFPVSYRGKKSMMQTSALQGQLQKLQKQYGKDQARLNEETQKLYEREGVNPMSGCLWSFLPLPILMGLYYIIRRPMLYMMCLTNDEITAAIEAVEKLGYDLGNQAYKEMALSSLIGTDSAVRSAVETAVGDSASKLVNIDFHWLGIDLSQTPNWKIWTLDLNWANIGLFLIPIVVTIVSLLYSQLSQKTNKLTMGDQQKQQQNATMDATNRTMMIMMPLMYLWFGYIMPAGMCVYMIFNSVFMAIQEVICAFMLRGKFAEMQAESERRAAEEKEREAQKKKEIAERRAAEAERNKSRKGKKKKAAAPAKQKDRPTEYSRVGVRPYARGRAYDPNRYPVTAYRDPQDVLDEAALEATLSKKKKPEPVPEELPEETVSAAEETLEETAAPLEETAAAEESVEETAAAEETAAEDVSDADKTFEEIDSELKND